MDLLFLRPYSIVMLYCIKVKLVAGYNTNTPHQPTQSPPLLLDEQTDQSMMSMLAT